MAEPAHGNVATGATGHRAAGLSWLLFGTCGRAGTSYFDHLAQVTRATAASGFDGVLVPFDPEGEDSWIVSSSLARESPRLAFVTEFSPDFASPVYAAKMSTTFQRFTGGRQLWKLVVDGDAASGRKLGDPVEGADRYVRADEFLKIVAAIWEGGAPTVDDRAGEASSHGAAADGFTLQGRFYTVEGGGLRDPLTRQRRPPVVLSGTTVEALALSAAHADLHLWEPRTAEELVGLRSALDRQAAAAGRRIGHVLQLGIVARETAAEAWKEVQTLWEGAQAGTAAERGELVHGEEIWSGFRRLGYAAHSGVVGSYEQVSAYLGAAASSGIEAFYLEATPSLEEAYRFGEHIAPLLAGRVEMRQAV